jgi:hypothetical protein
MEIKDIKSVIKKLVKTLLKILKEIKSLPNVWLYILMSLILTIIFFIFTFPYSSLIRHQLQMIGDSIGRSSEIGEVNFNLFTGAGIEGMTIVLKDGSEITFQNVELNMSILPALFSNSFNGKIIINNIKYSKDKTSINMVARSDFNLKFNSISEFPVNGKIKLDLQNVIVNGITVKEFDIPPVRFTSITADASLLKKKITIESLNASGPDIKGSINGSIMAAQSFQQSQLNLNIIVDSSSPFLANYRILLNKWIDSTNKIQLTIRGSMANPNIDALGQKNDSGTSVDTRIDSRVNPAEQRRVNPVEQRFEQRNNRRPAPNPPAPSAIRSQPVEQFVPPEPNKPLNSEGEED